ncbi:MAG: transposase [Caldilineaceae bacterium]|nr:transposase [Caldilineaceae bacterium]
MGTYIPDSAGISCSRVRADCPENAGRRAVAPVPRHLLGRAVWSAGAARDELQACVTEHLGDSGGVVVVDETGFPKQGTHSAGVAPQYCGTLGNCQVGVFLAYAGALGHTLLDRKLYLTEDWTQDPDRLRTVGLVPDTPFATKPERARQMLARARDAGVPMAWVTGDTVYGRSRALRRWLEEGLHHVLAAHDDWAWHRMSAGPGSKGERWYDWQCWILAEPEDADGGRYLLFRRSCTDPDDWQFAPQGCDLAVAGRRWSIEHAFEAAKQETGLDDDEVRSAHGWHRHVTLAMWALALLAVVRAVDPDRPSPSKKESPDTQPGSLQAGPRPGCGLSLPEIRRRGAAGPGLVALAAAPPVSGAVLPLPPATAPIATSTTVALRLLTDFLQI